MEPPRENIDSPLSITTPVSPKAEMARKNKLREFVLRHQKEYWFGCWNLTLFMWEIARYAGHLPRGQFGLGQGIPRATDGAWGFIDQHIGDTLETIELFYLSRIPVSLVARGIEIISDKKIDPRVKIGTSLLLSVIAVSALELTGRGGVSDPLDVMGAVFAGIWGTAGYEVIDYLFKPRETPLFDQWWNKISNLAKSSEEIDQKLLAQLDGWTRGLSPDPLTDKLDEVPVIDIDENKIPKDI